MIILWHHCSLIVCQCHKYQILQSSLQKLAAFKMSSAEVIAVPPSIIVFPWRNLNAHRIYVTVFLSFRPARDCEALISIKRHGEAEAWGARGGVGVGSNGERNVDAHICICIIMAKRCRARHVMK